MTLPATTVAESISPVTAAAGTPPWPRAMTAGSVAWLGSVAAYAVVTMSWWWAHGPAQPRDVLTIWYRWDTIAYLHIASHGYDPARPADMAFFPLYPVVVRLADMVLPAGPLVAGMTVSAACAWAVLVLLYRLASSELGSDVAGRAVTYLAAAPTAFFLFAAYNESMYILLAVAALYSMRTGRWWVAGMLGGLASGTRLWGVLLVLPLAVEYLRKRGWDWRRVRSDMLAVALIPVGVAAFSLYCWAALGDPLAWSHAQEYWHRSYNWPGAVLWHQVEAIAGKPVLGLEFAVGLLELLAPVVAAVLLALPSLNPRAMEVISMYSNVLYPSSAIQRVRRGWCDRFRFGVGSVVLLGVRIGVRA